MRAKRAVRTDGAPAAIGPYSQAIRAGGFVFVSGQIALDPATGQLVDGSAGAQVRRCLENARAILEACGATLADVVKATIYLRSMDDFQEVNAVWQEAFASTSAPPARSAVAVAALPRGARVEVEVMALDPDGGDAGS